MKLTDKLVIGQEVESPDGLGRVSGYLLCANEDEVEYRKLQTSIKPYVQVKLYIGSNFNKKYNPRNIKVLHNAQSSVDGEVLHNVLRSSGYMTNSQCYDMIDDLFEEFNISHK